MEKVIFIDGSEEFLGTVLDFNEDYVWVNISNLQMVYVCHPSNIFIMNNSKYFTVWDRKRSYKQIVENEKDSLSEHIFQDSNIKDELENQIAIHKLIAP